MAVGSIHFLRGGVGGQHFSPVQCCYSRQQRSLSLPAMRSACEVSACSVLADVNAPRGCTYQVCSTRPSDQVRMRFARMVGSSTRSLPRPLKWCCVVASVARLMLGHQNACDLESLVEGWYHSIIASPYATQRRKQKDET